MFVTAVLTVATAVDEALLVTEASKNDKLSKRAALGAVYSAASARVVTAASRLSNFAERVGVRSTDETAVEAGALELDATSKLSSLAARTVV
jgi:hypothetical protein